MNDREIRRRIHHAMDARLSGMTGDPWLAQRILYHTGGDKKVKKKISVGLVCVLILVIAAVTALAVGLTTYFERIIEQESVNGIIQNWPASRKVSLVQWMLDAGIQLDEKQVARLDSTTLSEAEKEELAMNIIQSYYPARDKVLTTVDIIAKEYGAYEQWPLELKAWYTSMLEKYQYEQKNGAFAKNILPQENDISQEQAQTIADGCLTEILGVDAEEIAQLASTVFFQEDIEKTGRVWYFHYYEKKTNELKYYAYINSDGTLLDCGSSVSSATTAAKLNEQFYELISYHSDEFFTVEGLATFANDLAPLINAAMSEGGIDKWPAYFAQIPYAFPDDTAISSDRAIKIGTQAILDHYGWSQTQLDENYVFTLSYRNNVGLHEWRLAYRIPQEGKLEAFTRFQTGEIPFCIVVKIDPFTASVRSLEEENDTDRFWFGE